MRISKTRTDGHRPSHSSLSARRPAHSGFTLIELLVVITIILALVGLVGAGVQIVLRKAKVTETRSDINSFVQGIAAYHSKLNQYPGVRLVAPEFGDELKEFNVFPELFSALYYPKRKGGALEEAPLANLKNDKIVIQTQDQDGNYVYSPISISDLEDNGKDAVKKYYLDAWGNPYFYRENAGKRTKHSWMIKEDMYDLWSWGENGENEAWRGLKDDEIDDVGNWN